MTCACAVLLRKLVCCRCMLSHRQVRWLQWSLLSVADKWCCFKWFGNQKFVTRPTICKPSAAKPWGLRFLGFAALGLPSENPSGALTLPLSTLSPPSTLSLGDSFSSLPLGFSTVAFKLDIVLEIRDKDNCCWDKIDYGAWGIWNQWRDFWSNSQRGLGAPLGWLWKLWWRPSAVSSCLHTNLFLKSLFFITLFASFVGLTINSFLSKHLECHDGLLLSTFIIHINHQGVNLIISRSNNIAGWGVQQVELTKRRNLSINQPCLTVLGRGLLLDPPSFVQTVMAQWPGFRNIAELQIKPKIWRGSIIAWFLSFFLSCLLACLLSCSSRWEQFWCYSGLWRCWLITNDWHHGRPSWHHGRPLWQQLNSNLTAT